MLAGTGSGSMTGRSAGLSVALATVALLIASAALFLVSGALRDPTRSPHGMLGSALWTTFGPHLVLLSLVALLLGLIVHFRRPGTLAWLVMTTGAVALLGSSYITARVISAVTDAGGSANPIEGLWLKPMQAAGPDVTETFRTVNGQALRAAVYEPTQSKRDRPVLVYIHGGGFMTGAMLETDADLRWFADQGWLVFSVEYRLWTQDDPTWDEAPRDVACALAWVGANAARYGADAHRLAVLGDSAGGNLAINLAYTAARDAVRSDCGSVPTPGAVVVQYPAVDPLAIYERGYPVSGFEPKMLMSGYIGGDPYQLPERVQAVSSYTYLSDRAPPTLILAPDKDGLVPSSSVYRFAEQARLAGVDIELVRIPFANHVYNQIASGSIGNQGRLSITYRYLLERGLAPERPQ